ncbi:MAG: putative cobaltochelatase [Chloroflexia bacterium]|nr:putative cobaltochelatase [Chloroflexia bacterium]
MSWRRPVYPFTALVGQERMKRALILNAINPRIGGLLIRGQKGTAKSTAVRALAYLLPQIEVVLDCPFHCPPDNPDLMCDHCRQRLEEGLDLPRQARKMQVVELPINASEDRLVGSFDLEQAICDGVRHFEPGLLAAAHRGFLYVDEVNLLDDHLVDLLLDAAAMGVNTVEREGISYSHPARFILVGTMNPEEGELRPQLLDRFGLCVEISGLTEVGERVEVIARRTAYERDPQAFVQAWQPPEDALRRRIVQAQELLPRLRPGKEHLRVVAELCLQMEVQGHRADITIVETALTNAALEGRQSLEAADLLLAAELALPHRMKRHPFEATGLDPQQVAQILQQQGPASPSNSGAAQEPRDPLVSPPAPTNLPEDNPQALVEAPRTILRGGSSDALYRVGLSVDGMVFEPGEIFRPRRLETARDRHPRRLPGRRSLTRTSRPQGRYVTSERPADGRLRDLALDASLRAAAPFQGRRERNGRAIALRPWDLCQKVRLRRARNVILFVVDASWSMAAEARMEATKGAILSLLLDAYQRRDRVGLVVFQRESARLLLTPTNSVDLARQRLENLPTGGKTPLSEGLLLAYQVLEQIRHQDREAMPLLVLLTDGQGNVSMTDLPPQEEARRVARQIGRRGIRCVVIDTEHEQFNRGLARQIADAAQGEYYHLAEIKARDLVQTVRGHLSTEERGQPLA